MWRATASLRLHLLAICLSLVVGQAAFAKTLVCDDGFCVFEETDVLDDVIVEGEGILLLSGTTVTGNIQVRNGGILAASGALIGGNVVANKAFLIDLVETTIDGNLTIKKTGGEGTVFGLLPSIALFDSNITRRVQIRDNDVNFIGVSENLIEGSFLLIDNVAELPISISDNTIEGGMKCKHNSPLPECSGNAVDGKVDCDCEELEP